MKEEMPLEGVVRVIRPTFLKFGIHSHASLERKKGIYLKFIRRWIVASTSQRQKKWPLIGRSQGHVTHCLNVGAHRISGTGKNKHVKLGGSWRLRLTKDKLLL